MRFGSVCSGIEAASIAWNPLGWEAAWLSEIEPFPSAVLAHHYPGVPNLGDMTALPARILSGEIEAPELFCGGTPCQAFSVAGLRQSLNDSRGNLSLTFCEIANAIDTIRLRRLQQPAIIFWENVPGVLNTKDNAFGCFLAGLAGEVDPLQPAGGKWSNAGVVLGPKRAVAWRVLDAQYFGLAQRRRRVFVVASARDWFDPASILFEFDGLRRDTAPSRKAGKAVTADVETSIRAFNKQRIGEYSEEDISSTCAARDYKDATDLVAYGIPGNWIGRKPENGGNAVDPMHNISPCQTKTDVHAVCCAHAFKIRGGCEGGGEGYLGQDEQVFTLSTHQDQHIFTQMAVRRLTPTECERLQGFPDSYTKIAWRNKPAEDCPDGPRYKALGNSWAVPVIRWIGKRINNHVS